MDARALAFCLVGLGVGALASSAIGDAHAESASAVKCTSWSTNVASVLRETKGSLTIRDVQAAEMQARLSGLVTEGFTEVLLYDLSDDGGRYEGVLCMRR